MKLYTIYQRIVLVTVMTALSGLALALLPVAGWVIAYLLLILTIGAWRRLPR